ncbi:MAG: hypothetical protein OJJ54_07185 [Pseudonocardia sp.]|nr:hypothetical protein [Pseudonocardia sp.]
MADDEPAAGAATLQAQVDALHRENALLHSRVTRLERQLSSAAPLIRQARTLSFWDFTPYEVTPDDTWVAVDRVQAMSLMAALAGIDHWDPWGSSIEPRPQP